MLEKLDCSASLISYGYNEELLIGEFFDKAVALLDTVVDDYEIIFINDGSTDDTANIAEEYANQNSRIRVFHNEKNLNVGPSFKRGVSFAKKEYVFWQTIDWSYDLTNIQTFLKLLKYYDVVFGERTVPKRPLSTLPFIRSFYSIETRSDNTFKAIVSLSNYYILKILFGLDTYDFQNIQFHKTRSLQSFVLKGRSPFLSLEILIRACENNQRLMAVPINFIPRKKGAAKGTSVKSISQSITDIISNWMSWGWRFRFSSKCKMARIDRFDKPLLIGKDERRVAAPILQH